VAVIGCGGAYLIDALIERGIAVAAVIDTAEALLAAFAARDLRPVLSRVPVIAVNRPDARRAIARVRARARHAVAHAPRLQTHEGLQALADGWEAVTPARPPRVVVAGPPSGGSLGIARSVARATRALGARVQFVDAGVFGGAYDAMGALPLERSRRITLQGHLAVLMGEVIVEVSHAFAADLVIALAQAPLGAPALERLRAQGTRSAFWFVENTRVLQYWRDVARHYDHFFAIQPGVVLEQIAAAGAPSPKYLPVACDPADHYPVTMTDGDRQRFGAPVAFAGAPYLNRRHVLAGLRDLGLRVWGEGWEATGLTSCLGAQGRFDVETLRKVVSATAVNVNLHSAEHVTGLDPQPDFVNPRTFELAACGGFQLVDRRVPLADLFADADLPTFGSAAELRALTISWLSKPAEERQAVAARARHRVLARHTYDDRVRQILAATLPPFLQGSTSDDEPASLDDALARFPDAAALGAEEALLRMAVAVQKEIGAR
jgi:spore maturation protein CgeB